MPQYQFAVDKSRIIPYLDLAQKLVNVEQIYQLDNGEFTADLLALDVDFTKLCPIRVNGGTLQNCKGGFAFNIPSQYGHISTNQVSLYYCKTEKCSYDEEYHSVVVFSFTSGKIVACGNQTDRGERLCHWILDSFK